MKKFISCLLAVAMIITMLPSYVKADDAITDDAITGTSGTWLGMTYTYINTDEDGYNWHDTCVLSGTQTESAKNYSYEDAPFYEATRHIIVNAKLTDCASLFKGCLRVESISFEKDFDMSGVTDMSGMFYGCDKLESLDLSKFNTTNVTDTSYMFYGCESLESLDLSKFNTTNVTDMSCMFLGCHILEDLDISKFDTTNVTDMSNMFYNCKNLESLDISNFNTQNVKNMDCMFCGCSKLESLDISNFDTSKVEDMSNMFSNCIGLISLDIDKSKFNTTNVVSMGAMFSNCVKLTDLKTNNFKTSNVADMERMFYNCSNLHKLDLSGWDTGKVEDMSNMFYGCSGLISLKLSKFDTSKVTNMWRMFYNCNRLEALDLSSFNTENVERMDDMFYNCNGLEALDLSSFNTENVERMDDMFYNCSSLKTLNLSSFKTPKLEIMDDLFYGCEELTALDLSGFDTRNCSMSWMGSLFYGCKRLTSIDLSNFELCGEYKSNYTYIFYHWFDGCDALTLIKTPKIHTNTRIKLPSNYYRLLSSTEVASTPITEILTNPTESYTLIKLDFEQSQATYKWSDDGKSCSAKIIGCYDGKEYTVTESATVTSKVKTNATSTSKGVTRYTATFANSAFTTQVKDVEDIDQLPAESASADSTPATYDQAEGSTEDGTISIADEETNLIFDTDIDNREDELSPFSCLQLKLSTKVSKGKVKNTLNWKKVDGADGYIIYSAKCGKALKKVATVASTKTSWSQSKLKKNTYYKYLVVAYKGDSVLCTSKTVHGIAGSKKYSNPVKIKGLKKSLTVKVGKTCKLKGKVTCEKKKKIQKHVACLRYESADTSIATVSKKGKVKGISKGKTTIYAYAQNGICKKIKVTVK